MAAVAQSVSGLADGSNARLKRDELVILAERVMRFRVEEVGATTHFYDMAKAREDDDGSLGWVGSVTRDGVVEGWNPVTDSAAWRQLLEVAYQRDGVRVEVAVYGMDTVVTIQTAGRASPASVIGMVSDGTAFALRQLAERTLLLPLLNRPWSCSSLGLES